MPERISILVLDDDDDFRKRLVQALRERDFFCLQAKSTGDLQQVIIDFEFTHAILDFRLKEEETGLDCLATIKVYNPQIEVVILTGYGTIATSVAAMNAGAKNFLTKPVGIHEIIEALGLAAEEKLAGASADPSGIKRVRVVADPPTLSQVQWEHINSVLDHHNGNISKAAKELGMHRRSLQRKLKLPPDQLK